MGDGAKSPAKMRKRAILCLGIDRFDDSSITPLTGAADDARAWGALFEHRLGYTVKVLTHNDLQRGQRLLPSIRHLMEPLGQGDIFALFIATHGKTMRLPPSGREDQVFMLPWASRSALERGEFDDESVITLGKLGRFTARAGVQRLFIIDACRSPLEVEKSTGRDGDDFAFEGGAVFRDFELYSRSKDSQDSPLTTLHSCDHGQKAQELPKLRRGLFSLSALGVLAHKLDLRQSLDANAALADEIGLRMASVAPQFGAAVQAQRPVVLGASLRLHDEADQHGAEMTRLLGEVETMFASGALDAPYRSCVRDTISRLEFLGLPSDQSLAVRDRLKRALDEREQRSEATHDARLLSDAEEVNTEAAWFHAFTEARSAEVRERARVRLKSIQDANKQSPLTASAEQNIVAGLKFRHLSHTPEMVWVGAGRLLFGAAPNDQHAQRWERPNTEIDLCRTFAIGVHMVTFDEYDYFCNACRTPLPDDAGWGRKQRPVINVSWNEANQYCTWLSKVTDRVYRLPSEAEWEYACGAQFWPVAEDKKTHRLACYKASAKGLHLPQFLARGTTSGRVGTSPVGSHPPNEFGICDMRGNAWEWVADHWAEDHSKVPLDGTPYQAENYSPERVLKGGAWSSGHHALRTSSRTGGAPDEKSPSWGFRVVCESKN